jgi:hypothetical protein
VREENLKAAAIAAVKPKKEVTKELTSREKALQVNSMLLVLSSKCSLHCIGTAFRIVFM